MTDLPSVTLRSTMARMTVMPRAVVHIVLGALTRLKAVHSVLVLMAGCALWTVPMRGHRVTPSSVGFMMAGGAPAEPAAY